MFRHISHIRRLLQPVSLSTRNVLYKSHINSVSTKCLNSLQRCFVISLGLLMHLIVSLVIQLNSASPNRCERFSQLRVQNPIFSSREMLDLNFNPK